MGRLTDAAEEGRRLEQLATADMADAPHSPIETRESGAASVEVDEIELVKMVLSTSRGTPIVVAVPPDVVVNDLMETIAWLAGDGPLSFRGTFIAAMESRPALQIAHRKTKEGN